MFEGGRERDGRPRFVTSRRGVILGTVDVAGREAHAGKAYLEGRSAVLELAHQIIRLYSFNDYEKGIYYNVAPISGGRPNGVVAGEARGVLRGRDSGKRGLPGDPGQAGQHGGPSDGGGLPGAGHLPDAVPRHGAERRQSQRLSPGGRGGGAAGLGAGGDRGPRRHRRGLSLHLRRPHGGRPLRHRRTDPHHGRAGAHPSIRDRTALCGDAGPAGITPAKRASARDWEGSPFPVSFSAGADDSQRRISRPVGA
ncbi:peptidase dimerization domain-containing protein [Oscillibacter sp.]|uniref:peptidase dimerization domain-containing protein n=1 Tax=Oscillibacter sp. TaxID=1945593 RepID=UPI0033900E59